MKILITGSAGFIGSALSIKLLDKGHEVVGIDNHNNYYDVSLKDTRLKRHLDHPNYKHIRIGIENREGIEKIFRNEIFDVVVNLAAQPGVRYSIKNPTTYIDSNLVGFANILEGCRHNNVKHLIYASSSSVYGLNSKMPFSAHDGTNHPVSLYAATKKANELMAHAYSNLYKLPTTGLRFFTVYGPYSRPDMALQKFAKAIMNDESIDIYNHGNHLRDFTYIDDVIEGIWKVLQKPALSNSDWNSKKPDPATSVAPYRIYNIGSNNPLNLMDYIKVLENTLDKKAKKNFLDLQPGDVINTYAQINDFVNEFEYKPLTSIEDGIAKFSSWFKEYYNK
ncbi:NAD-dependent epimerase [Candidatus Pelagibacter ubique]|jgi:UDP-glucuronate 4-epimerase|nr:NAD-dependent epimerase [Candidatus Pelagibacter ubique]